MPLDRKNNHPLNIGDTIMVVLMTFVGTFVFLISLFTVGFKAAWKRLMLFAVTGLIIDCFIVIIAFAVSMAVTF